MLRWFGLKEVIGRQQKSLDALVPYGKVLFKIRDSRKHFLYKMKNRIMRMKIKGCVWIEGTFLFCGSVNIDNSR